MRKIFKVGGIFILVIILIIIFVLIYAAVNYDEYRNKLAEAEYYRFSGNSMFYPDTVISDINTNKKNIFSEIDESDDNSEVYSYEFNENDYENIISAFFAQYWKSDIKTWDQIVILYHFDTCTDLYNDIDDLKYTYAKKIVIDHESVIITRDIVIIPNLGIIKWTEKAEHLDSMQKSIEVGSINYSINDVFEIYGEQCKNYDFKCDRSSIKISGSDYPNWQVMYYGSDGESYRCEINSVSGKIVNGKNN